MAEIRNVRVVRDAAALAAAAADHALNVLEATLASRPQAHLALAGGSTPRAMNALLTAEPRRGRLDWERVVFWFGDERCVPPDDAASNFRMNRETLLDPLGIPAERVHRMHGEGDPAAAAADYAAVLVRERGGEPQLDLVLLGMGPDGHTASLFPGTTRAIAHDALCVAHFVPKLESWRITLTHHVINRARNVMITAGGAEKAAALNAVLNGPRETDVYPSQLIHPSAGELDWFVDEAAAAQL